MDVANSFGGYGMLTKSSAHEYDVIVDGQFGSTGKGVAAELLCSLHKDPKLSYTVVTTNAGPNSGHTSYYKGDKIVLQQLPTYAVIAWRMGRKCDVIMNAGSILDLERLHFEVAANRPFGKSKVYIHPAAAVVTSEAKVADAALVAAIGSTGKGTGAALAAKIMRYPEAVASHYAQQIKDMNDYVVLGTRSIDKHYDRVLVEVSQGFSLSLNASDMYPFTTSRDCTVAQAISDAALHPRDLGSVMMVVRTFPIRVAGNSGPCYPDQHELTWDALGVEPEITTVTKKIRRVFSFSIEQFKQAMEFNRPNVVFVNFMNYLEKVGMSHSEMVKWVEHHIVQPSYDVAGIPPQIVLGFGSTSAEAIHYEVFKRGGRPA